MSKKRRGDRNTGGRVTPKKDAPIDNGADRLPNFEIVPTLESLGFDEDDRMQAILDPIDRLIELAPLALDVEAVRLVGLLNVPPDPSLELISEDLDPGANSLELLATLLPEGDIGVVDALYLVSVYGDEDASWAAGLLKASPIEPSAHLKTVGQMTLEEAWVVDHSNGRWHEICLVVSYPDTANSVLVAMIDEQNDGAATKMAALADAESLRDQIDARDGFSRRVIRLTDARDRMISALSATDSLPISSPAVEESLLVYRPLLDYVIALT